MIDHTDDPAEDELGRATAIMNNAANASVPQEPGSTIEERRVPVPLERIVDDTLPAFPVGAVPSVVGYWVDSISNALEVPTGLAGVSALGVLSTATCGRLYVTISSTTDWHVPAILYIAPIAAPGERKSPLLRAAMTGLTAAQHILRETHDHSAAEEAEGSFAPRVAKLQKDAVKESDDHERAAVLSEAKRLTELADLTDPGPIPSLWTGDTTGEALEDALNTFGGRYALISEEGGTLETVGRYSGGRPNLDALLKGHDGGELSVRRLGRGTTIVPAAHLTVMVMLQPAQLEVLSSPVMAGRGLAARFLYAFPKSRVGSRRLTGQDIVPAIKHGWKDAVCELTVDMWHRRAPCELALSPKAYRLLEAFHDGFEPLLAPGQKYESLSNWGSKLDGTIARIAALFHVAEPGWKDRGMEIDEETMAGACEVGQFLIGHAHRAIGTINAQDDVRLARRILDWLARESWPASFKVRDAHRGVGSSRHDMDQMRSALTLLEDHGFVWAITPDSATLAVHPDAPTVES